MEGLRGLGGLGTFEVFRAWLSGSEEIPSNDGTWRSPVAHLNGVQGVAGSNPAVPIRLARWLAEPPGLRAITAGSATEGS